jgi:starch phosphorylase
LHITLNPEIQMFDIQVKRIHEYKPQTLNIFSIIHRYLTIIGASPAERIQMTQQVSIVGGKSAPGYYATKLVNNVSRVVNADSIAGDLLKVVFVPNYNVSIAEMIIPAADINQQISTAGTEASGTSNMKFAFNTSLIVGTHDGANIEIGEAIGKENVFFFGALADEVDRLRATANQRLLNPDLARVFKTIWSELFQSVCYYTVGNCSDRHQWKC